MWRFDASESAEVALRSLERQLIVVDDAAVVAWRPGVRRSHCYQMGSVDGSAALSGAFWGLLFGLLFQLPLLGPLPRDAVLARIGLTDEFLQQVRDRITAGTSGLFLLTPSAVVDRIRVALADTHVELLVSNLDHEQAAALWRAFSADEDLDELDNLHDIVNR